MTAPRRILAIKLRSLGDTILMTAPLTELKAAYPQAEIDVVVSAAWAPLLEGHPAVARIFRYERHPHAASRAKAVARLALSIRRHRYDWAACFHASPSSATLAFASGAPVRSVHFHGHRDKNRYSTVQIAGKGSLKPIIERDMDTIRALGIQAPTGALPKVWLTDAEKEEADLRIQHLHGEPVIGLGLGASRPTKSWPIQRFAEVAVDWCARRNGRVIAVASNEESGLAAEFLAAVDREISAKTGDPAARAAIRTRISLEQGLPIRNLAALLSRLAVFVGNDSGPRHLALAVGTPTVTIFGPEDPFEWHPYPRDRHPYLFVESLNCRKDADPGMPPWCALNTCVTEKHLCMTAIKTDQVLAEIERVAAEGGR